MPITARIVKEETVDKQQDLRVQQCVELEQQVKDLQQRFITNLIVA